MKRISIAMLAGVSVLAMAPLAHAQQQPAGDPAAKEADDSTANQEIVVTGTSRSRIALDTPLAVSQLNAEALTRAGATSQADILNTIPTIKADGGGGEVAANIFVKGLPSGGQYQFTPLMYDGIPVLSSFGLNSSAYDVYARNDLGIARLEFVRGGVSNLFGPGSVAGLINYISKTGGDELEGVAQLEVAEKDRYRGDLALSGPLGNNLYFSLSGFYRIDKGPVRTNLDTKGGQIRGNLEYRFADNSGSIKVLGQYINDRVQFYLPIPLNGTTRARLAGNDGQLVNSVQNNFAAGLGFKIPGGGTFTSGINDGVKTRGGMIGLTFDKDFGDSGWAINGKVKYSDYKHQFGLWSDGDGVINVPETLQSFLTNRSLGSVANAQFTFVGGGAVPSNYLVFANRFTDRVRPVHDFTTELNITKKLATGSIDHAFTLGGFYGNASAGDYNVTTTYLAEFNNTPRLVNLVVTNPTTSAQTIVVNKGLLNAGAGYVNNRHEAQRYAGYFADQMKIGDRFNFDLGVRVERINGNISRERTSVTVTDTTANLAGALQDVIWGNGGFLTGKVSTTEWAFAAGALYKLTDDMSLYANGSRGYFFPELRSASFKPLPTGTAANASAAPGVQSYTAEIIKQAELGLKISKPAFSATLAFIYTKLDNRRQVLFVNDGLGGFTEKVNLVGTRSYGLEATVDVRLMKHLHATGNLTVQDSKYTAFDTTPANIGHKVERQPDVLYNAGLYYDDGTIDAAFFTNYTGDNYTASNNAIQLNGWNIANFDAGYKLALGGNSLRISVNVFNVFNTDAVTEGSPRQDNNQAANGAFFVGRPVLPRRITGRLTYSF